MLAAEKQIILKRQFGRYRGGTHRAAKQREIQQQAFGAVVTVCRRLFMLLFIVRS